jgi:hypothetical protein
MRARTPVQTQQQDHRCPPSHLHHQPRPPHPPLTPSPLRPLCPHVSLHNARGLLPPLLLHALQWRESPHRPQCCRRRTRAKPARPGAVSHFSPRSALCRASECMSVLGVRAGAHTPQPASCTAQSRPGVRRAQSAIPVPWRQNTACAPSMACAWTTGARTLQARAIRWWARGLAPRLIAERPGQSGGAGSDLRRRTRRARARQRKHWADTRTRTAGGRHAALVLTTRRRRPGRSCAQEGGILC